MIERANLFESYNDYENALKTLFESKKVAETCKENKYIFFITYNIGAIYVKTYNFSNAKLYLHKARFLAEKLKNNQLLTKVNQGLFAYQIKSESKSDSIEYYLNKVAYYSRNSTNYEELIDNYNNFFTYYINKNEYNKAENKILKANDLCSRISNKKIIGKVKQNLGFYYMITKNDYKKSIKIFEEIFKLYPNQENPNLISDVYLNTSYAYEKLGDYKTALSYIDKYLDIQEEVFNGRLHQKTQELETKYTIGKVEDEFFQKEKILKEKQDKNQKLFYVFAALLVFAGIIFYFYYQNLILKQKNKLKDLNNELQYKVISATLDGQDQERTKISGVLHDNVSALLSSVGLHLSALEGSLSPEQKNDLKKTRSLLNLAHDKVRDLSHELVSPILVKFGLQYALQDLCESHSNNLLRFEYDSSIPQNRKYNQEFETKVFYIVSELFNNIIKHSKASVAELNLKERSGKLVIIISDNGKGFDTKNTVKSNGFGLTQIKARVKNMKGSFKIKSEINVGTTITINIEV